MDELKKVDEPINVISAQEILGNKFNIYGDFDNPLFLAKDIANWIDNKQVSQMVELVDEDEKLMCKLVIGGQQRYCWMLTKKGVYRVLANSRSPKSVKIQNKIANNKLKNKSKESIFISNLSEILDEFKIKYKNQYSVDIYRIDLYIPKYKIAIEYDEAQHNAPKNMFKDKQREEYITRILGCTFIRLDYKNSDAKNIAIVLKNILKLK